MFLPLAQNVIAFCDAANINAQHSKTYFQMLSVPAGVRYNFSVAPAPPFYALIMHRSSFGNIMPDIWQFWSGHKGMVYHTGIITPDMIESGSLQWDVITSQNPLIFGLQNNDPGGHSRDFESYMWHINVLTANDLYLIKQAIIRMMIGEPLDEFLQEVREPRAIKVPIGTREYPTTVTISR